MKKSTALVNCYINPSTNVGNIVDERVVLLSHRNSSDVSDYEVNEELLAKYKVYQTGTICHLLLRQYFLAASVQSFRERIKGLKPMMFIGMYGPSGGNMKAFTGPKIYLNGEPKHPLPKDGFTSIASASFTGATFQQVYYCFCGSTCVLRY